MKNGKLNTVSGILDWSHANQFQIKLLLKTLGIPEDKIMNFEEENPNFVDPITRELMSNPVTISTGRTYDRSTIENLYNSQTVPKCPATNQPLASTDETSFTSYALKEIYFKKLAEWIGPYFKLYLEKTDTPVS